MLLQSSPDIESILRSDLAQVLAMEVARATINGTGTGAEPRGVLATPGIQEITKPADTMDYAPELANALFLANVGNVSFLVNSGFKLAVDKLLTTDGLPIGAAAFFRNYPHKFTSIMSTDSIMIAGDFSDIIQGTWSAVEVLVNPYMESAYRKGNVALRIILTMDVAVRHPESFATFEIDGV
jgi:HK97 family phage major capsid protein